MQSQKAEIGIKNNILKTQEMTQHMNFISDSEKLKTTILDAVKIVISSIINIIENQNIEKTNERACPGTIQELFSARELEKRIQDEINEHDRLQNIPPFDEENTAIVGNEWKVIFESGVKSNFRDGKVRWQGHVSIKVLETSCWLGPNDDNIYSEQFPVDGPGRRFKFIVYEPIQAAYYEGIIRSHKHLREVLGKYGQDLLDVKRDKTREMIMYICKYRLDIVVNTKTFDGIENPVGSPSYRIEFVSERLYSNLKVTPINLGEEDDEEINNKKLINLGNNMNCGVIFGLSFLIIRKCTRKENC
jgi:hypothetical protein